MKGKLKPRRALLVSSLAAIVAALALAIPAAAHHGGPGPSGSPAGTIASFDQSTGTLTIDLAGGGSVSGLVSRWTVLDCGHHGPGGPPWWGGSHGWDGPQGWGGSQGWEDHGRRGRSLRQGGHGWGNPSCTTESLTSGATVENAVLGLTEGKAFFAAIELEAAKEEPTSP